VREKCSDELYAQKKCCKVVNRHERRQYKSVFVFGIKTTHIRYLQKLITTTRCRWVSRNEHIMLLCSRIETEMRVGTIVRGKSFEWFSTMQICWKRGNRWPPKTWYLLCALKYVLGFERNFRFEWKDASRIDGTTGLYVCNCHRPIETNYEFQTVSKY